jgi:hypothetical protein
MRFNRFVALAGMIAAGLTLLCLTFAAKAGAADSPFRIAFDTSDVRVNVIGDLPLDSLDSKASLEGTIDESGNVTIPKGGFRMPEFGITEPVTVKAFMGIEAPATGTFDAATGRLDLDTQAGLWVSVNIEQLLGAAEGFGFDLGSIGSITPYLGLIGENLTCGFSPMDVHFSTEPNSVATGQRFAQGPGGRGAISAGFSKLGPFAGKTRVFGVIDVCKVLQAQLPGLLEGIGGETGGFDLGGLLDGLDPNALDSLDVGPGAITLTRTSVDPAVPGDPDGPPEAGGPAPARLKLSVTPRNRRARPGKQVRYRATVQNAGGRAAGNVAVCLRAPKQAVRVKRCRGFGRLAAGARKVRVFKLKLRKKAGRGSYRVRFGVRSGSGGQPQAKARLRVR